MKILYKKRMAALAIATVIGALQGCASSSDSAMPPPSMGSSTGNVSSASAPPAVGRDSGFPSPSNAWPADGTFPNPDSVRQLAPGMTRDQIYTLIGPPHFSEGFSVRTWNYLFHFRVPRESAAFNERSSVVTCQVKINFSNGRIGSMQDSPAGCIERAVRPAPPVLPVQPPPQPVLMQRTLSADALFLFDRWDLDSVNRAQGIKQLSAMADQIGAMHSVDHIDVLGYTDRIGTLQWNMLLSQRRAETIKNFLVTHGVPAAKITARGMGLTQPGTPCPPTARDELIRCLAPDRHVDVRVYGMQKERPDLGVGGN